MSVQTATVISNYSVVEMVTYLYGDLNLITQFLLDNPAIGAFGVDADLNLFTGGNVLFDPSLSNFIPAPLSFAPPPTQVTTATVTGQPTISIYDLTLQSYGTLDELVKLMVDNGVGGVEDSDTNRALTYRLDLAQSNQMNKYNAFNSIIYATYWYQTPPPGFLELEIATGIGGPYVLLENGVHIVLESFN